MSSDDWNGIFYVVLGAVAALAIMGGLLSALFWRMCKPVPHRHGERMLIVAGSAPEEEDSDDYDAQNSCVLTFG